MYVCMYARMNVPEKTMLANALEPLGLFSSVHLPIAHHKDSYNALRAASLASHGGLPLLFGSAT